MRMKLKTILLIVAAVAVAIMLFSFVGCKAPAPVVSSTTSNNTTNTITKDSTIGISADSAAMRMLVQCDSLGQLHILAFEQEQGRRIDIEAQFNQVSDALAASEQRNKDNENTWRNKLQRAIDRATKAETDLANIWAIDFDCNADSLEKVIEMQRTTIDRLQSEASKEPVEVIPEFNLRCTWGFWILLFINIVIIVWKVARFFYGRRIG